VVITGIGRRGTLEMVKSNDDLKNNLGVAAHLIHGSPEKRFKVTYCTEKIGREEIESVGYNWEDPNKILQKYDINKLKEGFNIIDNEEIFYVSNPALGLWKA